MNMLRDLLQPTRRNLLRGMFTATSALTRFAVNSVEAALALDFVGGEYRTANTSTTFADAFTGNSPKLTYSTAAGSNSTMTQGYGPELVENGDFATDSDWSKDTGWTISDGVATCDGTNAAQLTLANKVTAGSVYQVEFDVTSYTSGNLRVVLGSYGDIVPTITSPGRKTVVQTASSDGSLGFRSASFNGSIDNISVREAPKIVWAPHNLLDYSEDFSQWSAIAVGSGSAPVLVSSNNVAPDGTNTATRFEFNLNGNTTGTHLSTIQRSVTPNSAGVGHTFRLWVKSTDGTSTYNMLIGNQGAAPITVDGTWRPVELEFAVTGQLTPGIYLRSGQTPVNSDTADILVWGAHYHRSDLGGMAQVPGADTGFEYYVPTNGSAEYLPRVGHHVYNGSAWVNEGLLIESEARTNFEPDSNPSSPTSWPAIGLDYTGQILRTTGPDGVADSMFKLQESTATGGHYFIETTAVSVGTNTFSCIVKDAGDGRWVYWRTNNDGANQWINVNPATGEVTEVGTAVNDYGVIDLGNGFYRLWFSCDSADGSSGWVLGSSNTATPGAALPSFTGTLEAGFYCGLIQVEAGSTPSSYMPTSGGTYTRTAQSLTVPPAEFGWPEPEFIGPELVTNGTFDTDTNWTKGPGWTISGGVASCSGSSSSLVQNFTSVSGAVYEVSFDVSSYTSGTISTTVGGNYTAQQTVTNPTVGQTYNSVVVGGTNTTRGVEFYGGSFNGSIDNISVREINPLSVSIQMDGRMTYADGGSTQDNLLLTWAPSTSNRIYWAVNGGGAFNGALQIQQVNNNTYDKPGTVADYFAAGFNVPFNISSRHGSTFVNGAVDGVALTADTTPKALPDLSSTDLEIAKRFMGTIGTFRQFAGDIGDTGLVTATNPSTEPTLSLTFDGTEGSFYNLSWSE